MEQSLDYTRVALRSKFHQKPGEADRFDFITPDAIRGFIDSLLSLVAAVVVPITCISLVVGGIVIMNIMLVSVTERTREIGIRKSLGARRSDIMLQILIEAVLMAFAGGAIGVGLGAVLTTIVDGGLRSHAAGHACLCVSVRVRFGRRRRDQRLVSRHRKRRSSIPLWP